jgi:hypothetical protein
MPRGLAVCKRLSVLQYIIDTEEVEITQRSVFNGTNAHTFYKFIYFQLANAKRSGSVLTQSLTSHTSFIMSLSSTPVPKTKVDNVLRTKGT